MSAVKSRKILVTGGAGFIGSHLCDKLVRRGYDVTCLDNLSTGSVDNIKNINYVRFVKADANNASVWRRLREEKFEAVFHYAATVGVKRTEENPQLVLNDVMGLRHLFQFAAAGNVKKVIFASSSEVYGHPQQLPEKEENGVIAWSPYTTVKIYGEQLLEALWRHYRIQTVALRFFNVYGPGQAGNDYGFVVAKFIKQALNGESLTVYGDGNQTRDFVYVDDNIAAAIAAFEKSFSRSQVINVGTGKETSVNDLAAEITKIVPVEGEAVVHLSDRLHEVQRRQADTKRLRRLLSASCQTSLRDGLRKTIPWFAGQASVLSKQGKRLPLQVVG